MTDARVTQTGLEIAAIGSPALRATQAGLEIAVLGSPVLRVTQIGLEVAIDLRAAEQWPIIMMIP